MMLNFEMNYDEVEKMKALLGETYNEVLTIFLTDTEEKIDQLMKASEEKDVNNMNLIAHQLKSSTASFGAASLSRFCELLENSTKEGKLSSDAPALCATIKTHYQDVRRFYSSLR